MQRTERVVSSYLIIQTVTVILCFQTETSVFIINGTSSSLDTVEEISRVKLQTFLRGLGGESSAALLVDESKREERFTPLLFDRSPSSYFPNERFPSPSTTNIMS